MSHKKNSCINNALYSVKLKVLYLSISHTGSEKYQHIYSTDVPGFFFSSD